MDSYPEKDKDKADQNEEDMHNIRIILRSQETKNLEHVANTLAKNAREKGYEVKGPRFMPNKILSLTVRKSPCGEGTNTFDAYKMKIHTRIVDIKCSANNVSEITRFKIRPGVDINMKIWN